MFRFSRAGKVSKFSLNSGQFQLSSKFVSEVVGVGPCSFGTGYIWCSLGDTHA
jgi:hypothetical protein